MSTEEEDLKTTATEVVVETEVGALSEEEGDEAGDAQPEGSDLAALFESVDAALDPQAVDAAHRAFREGIVERASRQNDAGQCLARIRQLNDTYANEWRSKEWAESETGRAIIQQWWALKARFDALSDRNGSDPGYDLHWDCLVGRTRDEYNAALDQAIEGVVDARDDQQPKILSLLRQLSEEERAKGEDRSQLIFRRHQRGGSYAVFVPADEDDPIVRRILPALAACRRRVSAIEHRERELQRAFLVGEEYSVDHAVKQIRALTRGELVEDSTIAVYVRSLRIPPPRDRVHASDDHLQQWMWSGVLRIRMYSVDRPRSNVVSYEAAGGEIARRVPVGVQQWAPLGGVRLGFRQAHAEVLEALLKYFGDRLKEYDALRKARKAEREEYRRQAEAAGAYDPSKEPKLPLLSDFLGVGAFDERFARPRRGRNRNRDERQPAVNGSAANGVPESGAEAGAVRTTDPATPPATP